MTCIGYLRALLEDVAARKLPAAVSAGGGVTVAQPRFDDYLLPVVEIATYAGSDVRVVQTLLDALESVARRCEHQLRVAQIAELVEQIRASGLRDARIEADRQRLLGAATS